MHTAPATLQSAMTSASLGHVAFRVDASVTIGTGHLARCIALAQELRHSASSITFYSRATDDSLRQWIKSENFEFKPLSVTNPKPSLSERMPYANWLGVAWEADADEVIEASSARADWLIIDHYALDARWENRVRNHVGHILSIDDLADRPHAGDFLLDANWHPRASERYAGLLAPRTKSLLGPRYALLRAEFAAAIQRRSPRVGPIKQILVFLGGSDPLNLTAKALQAMRSLPQSISIEVVGGPVNPHHVELEGFIKSLPNARYHRQVSNMAELILKSDLAIGGGGQASWERVALGLPSISIPWAENQLPATQQLADAGALTLLSKEEATEDQLRIQIQRLMETPDLIRQMSERDLEVAKEATAHGAAHVVQAMKEISL